MNIEELKFRAKCDYYKLKTDVEEKVQETKTFIVNNKETLIALAPVAVAAIAEGSKITGRIGREHALRAEEHHRKYDIYDRSLGKYYHLKRPLTQRQQIELSNRKKSGESYAQILSDMHLI